MFKVCYANFYILIFWHYLTDYIEFLKEDNSLLILNMLIRIKTGYFSRLP